MQPQNYYGSQDKIPSSPHPPHPILSLHCHLSLLIAFAIHNAIIMFCICSFFSLAALSLVFVNYVYKLLSEVTDVASAASYQMHFDLLPSGLSLQFSGYSDPEVFMRFMKEVLSGKRLKCYNYIYSTSGQTCPSGRSLRVLGVCQLVGHRLVMPLLLRPQLVKHWLVMHALAKDSPGWPGDVSVTDLPCPCRLSAI